MSWRSGELGVSKNQDTIIDSNLEGSHDKDTHQKEPYICEKSHIDTIWHILHLADHMP